MQAAHLDDPLAQVGVGGERRGRLVEQGLGGGGDARRRRARPLPVASRAASSCRSGSSAATSRARDLLEALPPASCLELVALVVAEPAVEPREAGGDRERRRRGRGRRRRPACSSFSSGTVGLRSSGAVSTRSLSVTPTASTITKRSFAVASGVTAWKSVVVDDPHAAALHLLEVGAALDRAHEEDALERLHVGAGGDHVDGDGDARVVGVAERGEQVVGLLAGRLVGDLAAKSLPLPNSSRTIWTMSSAWRRPWRRSASSAPRCGRGRSR